MESEDEHDGFQGREPRFGAIFMSSSATKNECLRRRLFGLPSAFGRFVKQVKTGMILFLFEYESRQLHGVFQACSDGEMNIFPRAYSSSGKGKHFPAQVKIKPIWHCYPLSESEFGDAIKDNYFKKWKFNFGLSKKQVRRLLTLFNVRKIKYLQPGRDITRSKGATPVSTLGEAREVDGGRARPDNEVNTELDADNRSEPMMTWNVGNGVHSWFISDNVDSKGEEIIQSGHLRHLLGKDGRGNAKVALCERAGNELNVDIANVISTPSVFDRLGQSGSHSNAGSYGDMIVTETLPYDPDAPLNLPQLPPIEVNHSLNSVEDCFDSNGIPSLRNQLSPLFPEPKGINHSLDVTSEFDEDTSVDKIMAVLTDCRYPWVQSKKSKVHSALDMNQLEKSKMASVTPFEDTDQISEEISFMNFKRRTELRKVDGAMKDTTIDGSAGNDGVPGGPRKRRKLFRPNFINNETGDGKSTETKSTSGKNSPIIEASRESSVNEDDNVKIRKLVRPYFRENVPCDDKSINGNASMILQHSSQQSSISEVACVICQESVGSQDMLVLQGSELSQVVHRRCLGNENIETERSTKYERETQVENFWAFRKIGSQDKVLVQVSELSHVVHQSSHENENTEIERSAKYQGVTQVERSEETLKLGSQGSDFSHVFHKSSLGNENIQTDTSAKKESELQVERSGAALNIGSQDKLLLQGSEFSQVVRDSSHVSEDTEAERFAKYERETQVKVSGATPKVGNEDGKVPLHDAGGQIASLAISCEEKDQKEFSNKERCDDKSRSGNTSLVSKASSQDSSDSEYSNGKRRKLIWPNFRENKPCDQKSMNGNTSLISEASSQESSDGEYANGKRRKLFLPNFRENKPCDEKCINGNTFLISEASSQESSDSEYGPKFSEKKQCDGKIISGNTSLSFQFSMSEDASRICQDSAGSQYELVLQGTELSHVAYLSSPENGNCQPETAPKYERERKVESLGATLKTGDGEKESKSKVEGQIAILAIPDEGNIPNAEKDLDHKHPIVNRSSQNSHDISRFIVHESALQVPRPKTDCGRCNGLELLSGAELCPNKSSISIRTDSSRDTNSGLQKVTTEVASCADSCIGDNHHGSSPNQSEAPLDTVGCFDKQEPFQEHRVATEVTSCAEACTGDNHRGSSPKQSEAPLDAVGRFDKQEPSQEHRSNDLSELSSGTVSPHDKFEPSPSGRNLNVHFGESLLLLGTGCKRDIFPIRSRNACASSGIGTSDNAEDKKDVLQNNGGIKNCKLKRAGKETTGSADEFELEDKKDFLQNSGRTEKRKLKRSCKQNTGVADEFESDSDECAAVECKRINQRLWRTLTSNLIELKNAQQ